MSNLQKYDVIKIENMIYEIRGKQVMLDSDLAKLYSVETKRINEAVKNNLDKFPNRFSFKLTDSEFFDLRSKFSTLESEIGQKNINNSLERRRYNPRVFTEQGVAMLATILKSKIATEVSIRIMDAFVEMRKYIGSNNYERRISNLEIKSIEYDNKFDEIFSKLDKKVNNHIFFEGQIYDAFSLLLDIFDSASEEIIVIDNYADKKILDIISKTNKNILVYSNNITEEIITKYCKQYNNVKLVKCEEFHDRFIIIDRKYVYHCGSSFKDLGKKCFAINLLEDKNILKEILIRLVK